MRVTEDSKNLLFGADDSSLGMRSDHLGRHHLPRLREAKVGMIFRKPLEPESPVPVVNVRAFVALSGDVVLETDAGDLIVFDSPDRALQAADALRKAVHAALAGHVDVVFESAAQKVPSAAQLELQDAAARRRRIRLPFS
jgi:hypothetical protein